MQDIGIEYNRQLKPLEALLSGVRQPGDFFVFGTVEIPMPRVEVKGAGTLSFPVPDVQIAAIVRQAERAPYGKDAGSPRDQIAPFWCTVTPRKPPACSAP